MDALDECKKEGDIKSNPLTVVSLTLDYDYRYLTLSNKSARAANSAGL